MALVTGLTAEAMAAIRDGVVIDGHVDGGGHLILTTQGGTDIDAGNVIGPAGSDATVPDADTSTKGKVELATDAETITGTDATRAVTPHGYAAANASLITLVNALKGDTGRNKIINGRFRVNQRGATSGTSLASGAYFVDRWKSTAATNAVTWTGNIYTGLILTIPSTKSIATIIERQDMPAGGYVLSWTGTAQGRVYNVGGTAPSYAASPITVTLDGSADVTVEFNAGTLSDVQLEAGSTPSTHEWLNVKDELDRCLRYFVVFIAGTIDIINPYRGTALTSGAQRIPQSFPVPMRTSPTITTPAGSTTIPVSYTSETAGSSVSKNILINSLSNMKMNGAYSSTINGSTSLAAALLLGSNTNDVWISAEL